MGVGGKSFVWFGYRVFMESWSFVVSEFFCFRFFGIYGGNCSVFFLGLFVGYYDRCRVRYGI